MKGKTLQKAKGMLQVLEKANSESIEKSVTSSEGL